MPTIIDYLKVVLIVQLFYAFSITMVTYALPAAELENSRVALFEGPADVYSEEYISSQVEGNVGKQFNLPVIELATLVFYSGNIVIDLLLNFITAVPQMFTLLISGFLLFFNLDAVVATQVKLFFETMITMLYIIGIITLLLSIRSGGTSLV